MNKYLTILLFLFCSCTQKAKIISVHDGDTFTAKCDNGKYIRIRLSGCDAVELAQPFGYDARNFADSILLNHSVNLKIVDHDKYHRSVCQVFINGQDFSDLIVRAGFAVVYRKYGTAQLLKEQGSAKKNNIGIWQGPVIMPYIFRKETK